MFSNPNHALPAPLASGAWAVARFGRASVYGALLLCGMSAWDVVPQSHHAQPPQEGERAPFPVHGLQKPGYLGVSLRDLDTAEASRLHAMGVMIVTVDRDAPAWTAGLRAGDIVVEMNGQSVDEVELLRKRLREYAPGATVTLRIRRGDGGEISYPVTLGDQQTIAQDALSRHLRLGTAPGPSTPALGLPVPAAGASMPAPLAQGFTAPPPPPPASHGMASTLFDALMPSTVYTGLEVGSLTPQLAAFFGVPPGGGLLVTDVRGNSPAAAAGLAAGDVILRADNRSVATRSALAHALRRAKGNVVALAVLRDHKEQVLSLQPGKRKGL